ncbi:MAG: DUF983 domain-containing protein [Hyphomicrobiales bacterium]|nr:DUF983 domain-containing protein [Hyphomicrobiales bacterium]
MSAFRGWQSPRRGRQLSPAIRRGLLGRCPACGRGRLFRSYLKLVNACKICGEDLSHARADDAPAYLTLLVVCHIVGAGVLLSDNSWLPPLLSALFWLTVTLIASLLILPRMKGAVVGQQWALCMHGFGGDFT